MTTLKIKTPRWALPLLDRTKRYLGAKGGRGSGKSHFVAEHLVQLCIDEPLNICCFREIQKSLSQSSKKLIEIKIDALGVSDLFDVQRDRIIGKNGSLFQFSGLRDQTADSIKSIEGIDVAWLEEAQNISASSLDVLRPTIRKPRSQIFCTWNPKSPSDAVENLPWETDASTLIHVNFSDNPWFPDVLKQELAYDRSRDIDRFNHVWLGQYQQHSEARVFKNWRVEEFEAPADTIFKLGADWGYAIDPTCLIRVYIQGRKLFIDYEAYRHNCEIFDLPELFGEIPDAQLFPIVADSSRPETISYVKKNGYPRIFGSKKGAGSIEDGIEWLKSFDIVIHPRCVKTISEFTNYSYKVDPHTQMVTSVVKDSHNHIIDAVRYACEGARKIVDTQKFVPAVSNKNYW